MPKVELPILNFPKQQTIFDCPARIVVVAKGRRFGLTRGAANDFIKEGLQDKFKRGLWVDTVNANIERYVERYFIPALRKLPDEMWHWRKQQKILRIKNAEIDFRSADNPENIEGFGYDKGFLNEAGIILKNSYLWNNAIQPMLWDYKDAHVIIGGAPKGKGVFFELANRGQDDLQTDYAFFRFTSFDNPYIQTDLIQEDIKSMPERVVRQEIYAEFLDDTGVVFRGVSAIAVLAPKEPVDGHLYVIGADLAKVQDFTVLSVFDRKTNNQVFSMRFNKYDWPYQKQIIKNLSKKYNNALVCIDSTGLGEPIADDLSRDGVPVEPTHFTNEVKKQLVEKLSNWIELGNCRLLNQREIIEEFSSFTYDYSEKTGRVMYNAPPGFHDDIVFSIALAIWQLQPIIKPRPEQKMTIIQRDIYEKTKALNQDQTGFDYGDLEII